jgi:alpha-ketoglutarate-dependent taurine dioxygenase
MQCLELPKIGANFNRVPTKFLAEISAIAGDFHNKISGNALAIQTGLEEAIAQQFPQLLDLGDKIVSYLNSKEGFVIVKNLPFLHYPRPLVDWLFLALTSCLGSLTIHNDSKQLIWEVTPRCSNGREQTFSELNGVAPWHTDSAFRRCPEEYFGLFALKTAKIGGHSLVMNAEDAIASLKKTDAGAQCLAILRSEIFPFRVPPAFRGDESDTSIIYAPIIRISPFIRFRLDTILSGFKSRPELMSVDRLWALNYFQHFLDTYKRKVEVKLDEGDIIFINNHKLLHGRTAFVGSDRLFLRARVEKRKS